LRAVYLAVLLAGRAGAQPAAPGVIVDQGSFTIAISGPAAEAGRETFAIRRAPGGYQASGTVLFADRRLSPSLTTDLTGAPVSYTLDARTGPGRLEQVSVVRDRGFFTLRARSPDHESVRELPELGTLIVDDEIVHQYYFLMLGHREGTVSVVVPQRRVVLPMRIERLGPDSVRIGGREIAAERVRVGSDSDGECFVWVDAAGRVLQLARPDQHLTAVRDNPP
jgi:hypothetical protein